MKTLIIWPGSFSSLLFTCLVFKFISLTTTLLLCLIISVISPTLPLSWPDITFTVSPNFTCILCSTGRLFGLHFLRSHRLSCRRNENEERFYKNVCLESPTVAPWKSITFYLLFIFISSNYKNVCLESPTDNIFWQLFRTAIKLV